MSEDLKNLLAAAKHLESGMARLQADCERITAERDTQAALAQRAIKQRTDLEHQVEASKVLLANSERDSEKFRTDAQVERRTRSVLETRVADLTKQLGKLNQETSGFTTERQKLIDERTAAIESLKQERVLSSRLDAKHELDLREARSRENAANTRVTQLSREMDSGRTAVNAAIVERDRAVQLTASKDADLKTTQKILDDERQKATQRYNASHNDLLAAQRRATALNLQVTELRSANAKLQNQVNDINAKFGEVTLSHASALNEAHARCEVLEARVKNEAQAARRALIEAQTRAASLDTRVAKLNAELADVKVRADNASANLTMKGGELLSVNSQLKNERKAWAEEKAELEGKAELYKKQFLEEQRMRVRATKER